MTITKHATSGRLALGLLLLLLAPVPPLAGQSSEATLRPGDSVLITVWRQPELSGEFAIAADSTILHPLYSGIRAAGEPLDVVRSRVRAFLEGYEAEPQFVLEPRFRVFVGGHVAAPRLYTFPPGTTLVQALSIAGGVSETGKASEVRFVRGGEEQRVDFTDPATGELALQLQSGDQIIVPGKSRVFREYVLPAITVVGSILSIVRFIDGS